MAQIQKDYPIQQFSFWKEKLKFLSLILTNKFYHLPLVAKTFKCEHGFAGGWVAKLWYKNELKSGEIDFDIL